jgi:hypothetical protein
MKNLLLLQKMIAFVKTMNCHRCIFGAGALLASGDRWVRFARSGPSNVVLPPTSPQKEMVLVLGL